MSRKIILCVFVMTAALSGCSRQAQEETQKVIDYGTGKKQVETYRQLQGQIRTIRREKAKQFEE